MTSTTIANRQSSQTNCLFHNLREVGVELKMNLNHFSFNSFYGLGLPNTHPQASSSFSSIFFLIKIKLSTVVTCFHSWRRNLGRNITCDLHVLSMNCLGYVQY